VCPRSPGYPASEQAYYDKITSLKASIAPDGRRRRSRPSWAPPERSGTRVDAGEVVEVWGYRGYEVLIDFAMGSSRAGSSGSCPEPMARVTSLALLTCVLLATVMPAAATHSMGRCRSHDSSRQNA